MRSWAEIAAIFRKEWRGEMRSRHGLFTAGLFSLVAVVAMAFSMTQSKPTAQGFAGMFTVVLLFAATVTLPRVFLSEDDQGTMPTLRMIARPEAVFWGKFLYALVQTLSVTMMLATVFVALTGVEISHWEWFVAGLLLESLSLCAAISVTGVLVVGARNRWLLGTAISMPLLLPQVSLSIGLLTNAFLPTRPTSAVSNAVGLLLLALAMLSFGPILANTMWGLERGASGEEPGD